MADIKINYTGLLQNKKDIEERIHELGELNKNLTNLLGRIEGSWEGTSGRRYVAKMREQKRKAEDMVSILTEFKKYIEEAVKQFQEEDRVDARKISAC